MQLAQARSYYTDLGRPDIAAALAVNALPELPSQTGPTQELIDEAKHLSVADALLQAKDFSPMQLAQARSYYTDLGRPDIAAALAVNALPELPSQTGPTQELIDEAKHLSVADALLQAKDFSPMQLAQARSYYTDLGRPDIAAALAVNALPELPSQTGPTQELIDEAKHLSVADALLQAKDFSPMQLAQARSYYTDLGRPDIAAALAVNALPELPSQTGPTQELIDEAKHLSVADALLQAKDFSPMQLAQARAYYTDVGRLDIVAALDKLNQTPNPVPAGITGQEPPKTTSQVGPTVTISYGRINQHHEHTNNHGHSAQTHYTDAAYHVGPHLAHHSIVCVPGSDCAVKG
ncbi:hypothetical protein SAMN05880558_11220 [Aeromonas sp. RU39B]|nr:hypothetical protein SAMN05880558_11220 [Aeromonas sp. RU39B]